MTENDYKVIEKIKSELEKIRPKLHQDGGDIEYIGYKDGTLKLRFLGECATCALSHITMKYAIENTLKEKIPELKKIIQVNLRII